MKYLIVYLDGKQPSNPEEGKRLYAKYQEWLAKLGNALIIPENPIKNTHTLKPDGSVTKESTTSMMGYMVVEMESMETVLRVTKSCPFLESGGTLEVSELIEMSPK